jgi:hypothetical protein
MRLQCQSWIKTRRAGHTEASFGTYQDSINKLVVFDYQEGRNKEGPAKMLATYKGTIQTDGYLVYDTIAESSGITLVHYS